MPSSRLPYINVTITTGATREQKKAIVEDLTQSLVRNLNKEPEHIVIDEVADENWGFADTLTDDYRKHSSGE